MRARYPFDPLPFFVALVDELPDSTVGRWRALGTQAARPGATTILLDDATSTAGDFAPAIVVGANGGIEDAAPGPLAAELAGARSFGLGAEEAADLLAPIAAVHNYAGPDPVPPPEDRAPEDRATEHPVVVDGTVVSPLSDEVADGSDKEPDRWPMPSEPPPIEHEPSMYEPPMPTPLRDGGGDGVADDEVATTERPIRVRVLGPAYVESFGTVVGSGLRESAYELLAWLVLRPEGATLEAAAEALWPGITPRRGSDRFWTALGNLRSLLGAPIRGRP